MKKPLKNTLIALGIATLYAVILRLFFGVEGWEDLFTVMSISFLFCIPTIMGILTVYFSDAEKAELRFYWFFAPWLPIFIFLVITILFSLEGWACWLMVLPLFLLAASLGGYIGRYLKRRKSQQHLSVSLLALLPLLLAPLEAMIEAIPGEYRAYTYIDIAAPAEVVWDNVTRVRAIPEEEDTGYLNRFLGFPRPVRAELDFKGVGAYREAVFTGGLVFHETVTDYIDNQKMVFDIKAYPHEIPSTTLDEHVVIGGDYFDVLNGTYELEALPNGQQRLHLYSHFKMNTTFNFYAGWWGRWIMQDIQNNILAVQKQRAEG